MEDDSDAHSYLEVEPLPKITREWIEPLVTIPSDLIECDGGEFSCVSDTDPFDQIVEEAIPQSLDLNRSGL